MRPPDSDVPDSAYRDAAYRAVERTTLRSVSRDIGMTAPGLQAFLDGTTPQARTRRKLREWYVREAAISRDVTEDSIRAALALVLDGVPDGKVRAAEKRLVALVEKVYKDAGIDPPKWVGRLLK